MRALRNLTLEATPGRVSTRAAKLEASANKTQVLQEGAAESITVQRGRRPVEFLDLLAVSVRPLFRALHKRGQPVLVDLPIDRGFGQCQLQRRLGARKNLELLLKVSMVSRARQALDLMAKLVHRLKHLVQARRYRCIALDHTIWRWRTRGCVIIQHSRRNRLRTRVPA